MGVRAAGGLLHDRLRRDRRRRPQRRGGTRYVWHPAETVNAVAYDTPIAGWRGRHVNTLRLWSARATDPISLEEFNRGDHVGALADRVRLEAISRVLYPSDETAAGHELRLRQEFFFASASLQDLLRRHKQQHGDLASLADHVAIQLNDTHPAIAIPELMRLLTDEHAIPWELAWNITTSVFNYTNHTLLPEALETWPVPLMEGLLPRHMQIIYLINALHLDAQRATGRDDDKFLASVSVIEENESRHVRMGHLAFLGSHRVNGVSALHTELMRKTVFRDLHGLYPDRIVNKTNGISFRRWLFQANPGLTALIAEAIGPGFQDDAGELEALAPLAADAGFRETMRRGTAGEQGRARPARRRATGRGYRSGRDVRRADQAHPRVQAAAPEHPRDHRAVQRDPRATDARLGAAREDLRRQGRRGLSAGEAHHQARDDVARVVNNDPAVRGQLKIVFLPNYNVSLAEAIIPAADLSEQISTAGMEASGTGNMKLALNGALTIGTLDGANIEICERVGAENIFIFGLKADEVAARRRADLDARDAIGKSHALAEALDAVAAGAFSPNDRTRYKGLVDSLRHHDYFMVTADFDAYRAAQRNVALLWKDKPAWWRRAVINTARVGWFSADRAILDYAREIWQAEPGPR